jgi:hypothetical protein
VGNDKNHLSLLDVLRHDGFHLIDYLVDAYDPRKKLGDMGTQKSLAWKSTILDKVAVQL